MPSTLPIIGIPCATYARPHPYPLAHGNNETYIRAVEVAGGVPLLIPLVQHEATLLAAFQAVDGLLFAGGVDLDPAYYSEEPHPALGSVNREQDRVEMQLLAWAKQFHKPVFAICRGFQLLNVAYGGTLYQDFPSQYQPISPTMNRLPANNAICQPTAYASPMIPNWLNCWAQRPLPSTPCIIKGSKIWGMSYRQSVGRMMA